LVDLGVCHVSDIIDSSTRPCEEFCEDFGREGGSNDLIVLAFPKFESPRAVRPDPIGNIPGIPTSRGPKYYFGIETKNHIIDQKQLFLQRVHGLATRMAKDQASVEEKCPVDHATRAAWLKSNSSRPVFPGTTTEAPRVNLDSSCDSSSVDQTLSPPPPSSHAPSTSWFSHYFSSSTAPAAPRTDQGLGEVRVVSTIPRGTPVDKNARPANSEAESEVSASGNWIYPSEKMFFEAMKRKGHKGEVADMKTIVPIHNAVNERAWKEIKEWEQPWGSDKRYDYSSLQPEIGLRMLIGHDRCGGPKLDSFLGLSTTMSPRARFNTLLGYTAPFDRHDWVVDRCGTKVEYIIDFYTGKNDGKGTGKLNFYLDVRPKLNTWEGWKMRASKAFGLV
jgi:cytochrome c heme-lyase